MDETVVNSGQVFYAPAFGIGSKSSRDSWLLGLVNSAPYLCCALIGLDVLMSSVIMVLVY